MIGGDQDPAIEVVELLGKTGAVEFRQRSEKVVNVGIIESITVTSNVVLVAH